MRTLKLSLLVTSLIAGSVFAQQGNPVQNKEALVQSLKKGLLNATNIQDIVKSGVSPDQAQLPKVPLGDCPTDLPRTTNEGIPDRPITLDEEILSAYSATELIKQSLEERTQMQLGPRITYMRQQAGIIVHASGTKTDEQLLRITLNRGVDIMDHALWAAGDNTQEVQRWVANFYKLNFELAAAYGNNKIILEPTVEEAATAKANGTELSASEYLKRKSLASFGHEFALSLWEQSKGLESNVAKATILIKLVSYLAWDIRMDLRRSEAPLAQAVLDLYRIQHSAEVSRILAQIETGVPPAQADVDQLRSKVYNVLQNMPERLQKVGINPSNTIQAGKNGDLRKEAK